MVAEVHDGRSEAELEAEAGVVLPDRAVVSLDPGSDLHRALDVTAPVDLAVAANANVAAPIDAAVAANVLSVGSEAQAVADQGSVGDATADATQTSGSDQSGDSIGDGSGGTGIGTDGGGTGGTDPMPAQGHGLVADADRAAPINGAVAANANVAAPIDAAAAANVGSVASEATAVAQESAVIDQRIDGDADAAADQDPEIT